MFNCHLLANSLAVGTRKLIIGIAYIDTFVLLCLCHSMLSCAWYFYITEKDTCSWLLVMCFSLCIFGFVCLYDETTYLSHELNLFLVKYTIRYEQKNYTIWQLWVKYLPSNMPLSQHKCRYDMLKCNQFDAIKM